MSSIYAGETQDLQYDPEAKEFSEKPVPGAPIFRVRSLNYFEAQEVLGQADPKDQVRKGIELGLVAIDGNEDKAREFLAKPRARLVNPLFTAVWLATWGN